MDSILRHHMLLVVSEDSVIKDNIWPKSIEGKHVKKQKTSKTADKALKICIINILTFNSLMKNLK